ncbi:MAG: hypothetical protein ISS31_01450 [Kiritimatiellae bacterium]|nr:hypothetical protein [Kiritimatiellia bacterium]
MGDEEKTLDAVEETASDEAAETPEAAVTIDSEEAPEPEAPKLKLAPQEDEGADELLGAPEESETLEDEGQLGLPDAVPPKKGLAALFGGSKAAAGPDAEDETPKWAMPGARTKRQGSGIRVVNRVLAAAVILILVFGVLDLFATIRQAPSDLALLDSPAPSGDLPAGDTSGSSEGLPVLANLLESFSKRPIVRDLDRGGGETTVQVVPTRTKVPDWRVRAQKLDLIGLSGSPNGEMEAIVADREASRMHFLKVGQDMVVGENQFKLVRIATDHVAFEKDGDEVIVK